MDIERFHYEADMKFFAYLYNKNFQEKLAKIANMRHLNDKKNLRHVHHAKPQRKNMQLTFLQNNDNSNLRHALLTFSKILIVCIVFIQNCTCLISIVTQFENSTKTIAIFIAFRISLVVI